MSSSEANDRCTVCGDGGSKYHYGVLTCHGCKAFFRRTVRLKLQYTCRYSQACEIDSSRRNVCRFCRFSKCLIAGMKVEAVQSPRDPISKRNLPNNNNISFNNSNNSGNSSPAHSDIQFPVAKTEPEDDLHPISSTTTSMADNFRNSTASPKSLSYEFPSSSGGGNSSAFVPTTKLVRPVATVDPASQQLLANKMPAGLMKSSQIAGEDMMQSLRDCAFWSRMSVSEIATFVSTNFSVVLTAIGKLDELYHELRRARQNSRPAAERGLNEFGFVAATLEDCLRSCKEEMLLKAHMLKFFRSFQDMPIDDRVALFRSHAAEELIWTLVKRSLPFEDLLLLHDERHVISRDTFRSFCAVPGFGALVKNLFDDIIGQVRRLDLDTSELYLLRSSGFWNPDVCSDESKEMVRKKQLCGLIVLETHIKNQSVKIPGRYGLMVMLLKTVRSVAQGFAEKLRMSKIFDMISVDDFLKDIFKDAELPWGPLGEELLSPKPPLGPSTSTVSSGFASPNSRPSVVVAGEGASYPGPSLSNLGADGPQFAELQPVCGASSIDIQNILKPDMEAFREDWTFLNIL